MYESENELVIDFINNSDIFIKLVSPSSTSRRKFVITEFDSEYGIADIVLGFFKKSAHISTLKHVNPNWLYSINEFSKGEQFTFDSFINRCSISVSQGRRVISHFRESGYLAKNQDGSFTKMKNFNPIVERVYSIEAKISDWKKALKQAYRYKRFSNQSYVLLPEDKANSAIKNIAEFKKYNIGLVTLNDKEIIIHNEPMLVENIKPNALARINEFAISGYQSS